jgi:predicted PurR-regulated permease PerM
MSKTVQVAISIAILVGLIGGSAYITQSTLIESSRRLAGYIEEIEKNTEKENWEQALNTVKKVEEDWNKTQRVWCMLIDHMEIDNVNNTMSKISRLIEYREKALALSEMSTLKDYVEHIPDRLALSIENIF